jgi:hypothetical protein
MNKANRVRVDYSPGPAALEVLRAAGELYPRLNTQALVDKLLITGFAALVQVQWQPPALYGRDRDGWTLPADLRQHLPGEEV